ncbi:rhodanese-like domain-containing protein [Haloarchaeobius salinus]|uniref:rhodanese-like domain-containing protein n=1 Tax=Haloarchaeobius salinus TaxID=1198298 RepID=UPI00210988D9|nr:rhodanese-like domain-containing protein [Haloarchaeobius salinus]
MRRRTFLASSAALGAAGLAGCLAGGSDANVTVVEGETISLQAVDKTYDWHQAESARFVDARGPGQYDQSHIVGAVSSPAANPGGPGDPVMDWDTDTRIVCYCGCPHHLSSLRAAHLQKNGYSDVHVIDEGYFEWVDRGYPVTGQSSTAFYEISGETDPDDADEMAWVRDLASDQDEAAPIAADGSYTVHVRFADITEESVLTLSTPSYTVEAPLGRLADGLVTGP